MLGIFSDNNYDYDYIYIYVLVSRVGFNRKLLLQDMFFSSGLKQMEVLLARRGLGNEEGGILLRLAEVHALGLRGKAVVALFPCIGTVGTNQSADCGDIFFI